MRAVTFMGQSRMEVRDAGYPKLADPKGRKIDHAVTISNVCGSDPRIYNGRFAALPGMLMGHKNTGEVIEIGSHVEYIKKVISAPCRSTWHADLHQLQGTLHQRLAPRE